MAKLLMFLLILVVSASAQSDDRIQTSNENTTVTFDLRKGSSYLAFLAGEDDASFTFEVDGLMFMEKGEENSTTKSHQSFEAQRWHLMKVFVGYRESKITVTLYPSTLYTTIAGDLGQPPKIKIKSNEKIYWTQCKDLFSCYFPGSVLQATSCRRNSPLNSTTLVLIIVCGFLVVTVIVLVVTILIRWKKSELTEPEPIYEEINLSGTLGNFPKGQNHHETINGLYGTTIQRTAIV